MAGEEAAVPAVGGADGAGDTTSEAWTSKYMGFEGDSGLNDSQDDKPKSPSYLSFTASFKSGRDLFADSLSAPLPGQQSVSEKVAASAARLRSEARVQEQKQQEKLQAALAKAQSRPSGCPPIRPKSEEPESIESRAARRRQEERQRTMERLERVMKLTEKVRQREPMYRTEEVCNSSELIGQQVAERRRKAAEETRQRQQALRDTALSGRSKSSLAGTSKTEAGITRRLSEAALGKKMEAKAIEKEQWEKIRNMRQSGAKRSVETFFPMFRKGRAETAV